MRLFCCFFLVFISHFSNAALPVRYRNMVFDKIEIKSDVTYGQNTTQAGEEKLLLLDIYQPAGDTVKKRPLIILAHGGFFLYGSKETLVLEADSLARAGYVVASMNYRLIDVEQSPFAYKRAVIDAVSDMKAAVRFFTKNFEEGNSFGIDTSNIFIGGYSAGAITSLHYAYATNLQDVAVMGGKPLLQYTEKQGGLQGDSGNPGYSTRVRGVINIAGSLHHAGLIDAHEPILFSVHGTEDDVVPYNTGTSGESEVETEGSGLLHPRAQELGMINTLITIEGGDHLSFFRECDSCMDELLKFLYSNLN